jgi:hypothetical protein
LTAVTVDDRPANRQTQSGPARLRGDERIEGAVQVFGSMPGPESSTSPTMARPLPDLVLTAALPQRAISLGAADGQNERTSPAPHVKCPAGSPSPTLAGAFATDGVCHENALLRPDRRRRAVERKLLCHGRRGRAWWRTRPAPRSNGY